MFLITGLQAAHAHSQHFVITHFAELALAAIAASARLSSWLKLRLGVSGDLRAALEFFPAIRRNDPYPPWQHPVLLAFAGIRGIVSLAAALGNPLDRR